MEILSTHNADDYLYELKENMGSSTDFGTERFTGLFLGHFFCITHYCSYEWQDRCTCQKNTAIGVVRDSVDGCTVKYFTTAGEIRPQILIPIYLIAIITSLLFTGNLGIALYLIGYFTLAAAFTAIVEPMTQAGKDGKKSLYALLADPQNPYNNL